MLANICANPDMLKIMKFVNMAITLAKVILPLIIIVKSSFSLAKVVTTGDQGEMPKAVKKMGMSIVFAILIFFVPTVVNTILSFVDSDIQFLVCFNDATDENIRAAYIRQAENYLSKAEDSLDSFDYNNAKFYISQLEAGTEKENLTKRLDIVLKTINDKKDKQQELDIQARVKESENEEEKNEELTISGSYYSDGECIANPGIALESEPDPSCAINYWKKNNNVMAYSFIYPTDSATGLSLGAWPSVYKDFPTKLEKPKVYMEGKLIFPTTPVGGNYWFVYEHVTMDIGAVFGTPVYSPVDGTLEFSSWGGTVNKGSDETAYTVSIVMDNPFTYNGKTINTAYLTHMSGIIYRCTSAYQCNKHVSKGELLGFVGNATGTSETVGWMPHLHMSLYGKGNYDGGLTTSELEEIYGIVTNRDLNVRFPKKAGE